MFVKLNTTSKVAEGNFVKAIKKDNFYEIFLEDTSIGTIEDSNLLVCPEYKGKIIEVAEEEITVQIYTYVPVHTHSEYSLLDGAIRVKDLIKALPYSGALTDHGNMYGFLEFYKGMKKAGKKAIIGFEAYCENIEGKKQGNHLILLAKNLKGVSNLKKLTSEAFENFKRKPYVTYENLEKYSEGIICTSACLAGEIATVLKAEGGYEKAKEIAKRFISIFGKENYFIEIQRHNLEDEKIVNPQLIKLAKELGVGLLATADSHYLNKEDAYAHEVLLCLQTGTTINNPKHFKFDGEDYHLLSVEEMEEKFSDLPEALANSVKIAETCNVELKLNDYRMPNFPIPNGYSSKEEYFRYLATKGFDDRFGGTEKDNQIYKERFEYEMSVISQMKFEEYFLIIWDFLNFSRSQGIAVGPGRGSAVGSLVAYCLGITDIDPIPYNLLFERFLNPERVSMPDVDSDIQDDRRNEVIEYLTQKYGSENVCKIITFGTMKAKMALKDVARALGFEAAFGNKLSKFIPSNDLKITIKKALTENPEFEGFYKTSPDAKKVVDTAMVLEGLARHSSVHACGFVISPSKVTDFLPTTLMEDDATKTKETTSQVAKEEVEELGLLKMDLLGLRTLTVIQRTLEQIKEHYGIDMKMSDIPLDDRETYQTLAKGDSLGVFQLESAGMRDLIQNLFSDIDNVSEKNLPQMFERSVTALSLYRPGPMNYIPDYLNGMRFPEQIVYDCPEEEEILKATYGQIVYQEQVMQIVQKLAGYTLGRADLVRKSMGKKKQDVMDAEEKVFIYGNLDYCVDKGEKPVNGCVNNGIPEEVARGIWAKMKKFAEYAFNKSHATAYAALAIYTAWLRVHYPYEFYTSTLNSVINKPDDLKKYVVGIKKLGYNILPPDINSSYEDFTVYYDGDSPNAIRFGFRGLKGLNKFAPAIPLARKQTPFTDIYDFTKRLGECGGMDKAGFEALIYSGALDLIPGTRAGYINALPAIVTETKFWHERSQSDQLSLFENETVKLTSSISVETEKDFPCEYKYAMEKEYAGFYVSGNPLEEYDDLIKGNKQIVPIEEIRNLRTQREFITYGIVTNTKTFFGQKGIIGNFVLENAYEQIPCICFTEAYESGRDLLYEDNIVAIKGRYQVHDTFGEQLVVSQVLDIKKYLYSNAYPINLVCEINSKDEQDKLLKIVGENAGNDTYVVISAKGKLYKLPTKVSFSPSLVSALQEEFKTVAHY